MFIVTTVEMVMDVHSDYCRDVVKSTIITSNRIKLSPSGIKSRHGPYTKM